MKSELPINLTDAEWKALYSVISTPAGSDAFKKKIVQSINQVSNKKIIDVSKSQISTNKIAFIKQG
jgi:hypothetical protein